MMPLRCLDGAESPVLCKLFSCRGSKTEKGKTGENPKSQTPKPKTETPIPTPKRKIVGKREKDKKRQRGIANAPSPLFIAK